MAMFHSVDDVMANPGLLSNDELGSFQDAFPVTGDYDDDCELEAFGMHECGMAEAGGFLRFDE